MHLHYPFIFGSELTLLGRLAASAGAQAALIVHYKNRLLGKGPRGVLFEAYEHTVAPALIRAADRICVLCPDHADSVPYLRRSARATPEQLIEMPNGVDADALRSGHRRRPGVRERLGIPADAVVAAFVATLDRAHHFKRLDVAIEALARARRRATSTCVVAGGGGAARRLPSAAGAAGVAERVHFLGAVPHAELPAVLRAVRPVRAHRPSRRSRSGSS